LAALHGLYSASVTRASVSMSERSVDQALVARVQKGDRAAFDLLVRKYQHKVAKLIGRYVRNRAEVEDVAQETFIRAYRAIGAFRGDSAFYTWLYRIAVNTAKNYLESQSRRPPGADVEIETAELLDAAEPLRDTATPERNALTAEIADTVRRAIERLPADLRMAITLREIEGLSYEEIAEVMDCPIGTVRSRIFRAREAIDQDLKPLLEK
jgi:RNA polymerase sigma-70 factor (ECF subfamily)